MFGSLGVPELLIILLIVIIIFGAYKLPQLGKGLGQGIRNFKDSVKGDETPAADTTRAQPRTRERSYRVRGLRSALARTRDDCARGCRAARLTSSSMMSGETRIFSRGSRMLRMPTLLRSVLRWMPSEHAARPRFPEDRFTAPTMYFFSNSFLARSSEIPWARSSSMISWSCPSRFTMPSHAITKANRGGGHLSRGNRKR